MYFGKHSESLEFKGIMVNPNLGPRNWTHLNVCWWIEHDEGLNQLARECVKRSKTRLEATRMLLELLTTAGMYKTPNGAKYSARAIYAALRRLS